MGAFFLISFCYIIQEIRPELLLLSFQEEEKPAADNFCPDQGITVLNFAWFEFEHGIDVLLLLSGERPIQVRLARPKP